MMPPTNNCILSILIANLLFPNPFRCFCFNFSCESLFNFSRKPSSPWEVVLMEETFVINGHSSQVSFNSGGLEWMDTTKNRTESIQTSEIVSCWLCPKGDYKCGPSFADQSSGDASTAKSTNTDVRINIDDNNSAVTSSAPTTQLPLKKSLPSNTAELGTASIAVSSSKGGASIAFQKIHPSEEANVGQAPQNFSNYKTFSHENNTGGGIAPSASPCHHQKGLLKGTLCVEFCERVLPKKLCCRPGGEEEHIVGKWRTRTVLLCHESADVVKTWHFSIWNAVQGQTERPRHLVVIINPVGGRRDAGAIYRRHVAPLFARAAITTTMMETTPQSGGTTQAREAVSTPGVDGVVVMGGDGSLSQVIRGLLEEAAHRANVDLDDPKADLPQARIRVGSIPTGTTNCTTRCLHGTDDTVTATLHIVMGDRRGIDIVGIYDANDRLVAFTTNCISLGFLGDIAVRQERLRRRVVSRAGRVLLAALATVCKLRSHSASIRARTPTNCLTSPLDPHICTATCAVCSSREGSCAKDGDSVWVELSDEYFCLFALLVSARGSATRYGLSPAAHLGDGCMDLLLFPKRGLVRAAVNVGRALLTRDHLQNKDVTVLRCTEAVFTCSEQANWSFDGEPLSSLSYRMRVHRQRAQMFARGFEIFHSRPDWELKPPFRQ